MREFFNSTTLQNLDDAPISEITQILAASLQAADPYLAVKRNLSTSPDWIKVGDKALPLYPDSRIVLVAIGKASAAMADAVMDQVENLITAGICVCKQLPQNRSVNRKITMIQSSHPVPNQKSIQAANGIRQIVSGLTGRDLVILLISGGGSALVCLPPDGIELKDIQSVTGGLLKSGASINEMNAVRKHLDEFKGGGFLKMCPLARVAALVVSDVVGSPLDVIASGPAVADTSTFSDACRILEKYIGLTNIPEAIRTRLEKGKLGLIEETVKPQDEIAQNAAHTIIASNQASAYAALAYCQQLGYQSELITCELVGEAAPAGRYLADQLNKIPFDGKKYACIAGGETVVKVTGKGIGGRNLEVALAAVKTMKGMKNSILVTLATDGEDGPTDAAGAVVTGNTYRAALAAGLNPDKFLAENDAYSFFKQVGGLILTGATGTNVNDLNFLFRY